MVDRRSGRLWSDEGFAPIREVEMGPLSPSMARQVGTDATSTSSMLSNHRCRPTGSLGPSDFRRVLHAARARDDYDQLTEPEADDGGGGLYDLDPATVSRSTPPARIGWSSARGTASLPAMSSMSAALTEHR